MDISFAQSFHQAQTFSGLTSTSLLKQSAASPNTAALNRDWARVKDFADQLSRHVDRIKSGRLNRPDGIKAYMTILELGSALQVAINPPSLAPSSDYSTIHEPSGTYSSPSIKPSTTAIALSSLLAKDATPTPRPAPINAVSPSAETLTESETESEESREIPTAHMLSAPKWIDTFEPQYTAPPQAITYTGYTPQAQYQVMPSCGQTYAVAAAPMLFPPPVEARSAMPAMSQQSDALGNSPKRVKTNAVRASMFVNPCVAKAVDHPVMIAPSVIPQDETQSAFQDYKLVAHTKPNGNLEFLMTKDERKRHRGRRANTIGLICFECQATETPEWRRGPKGAKTLCNACGLQYAKKLKREGRDVDVLGRNKFN